MGDALRSDILTSASSDARAWERLVETSAPNPSPPTVATASEADVQIGRENQSDGEAVDTLPQTTVPTIDDVDRVRSKLVLLRDSMLGPAQQRQSEGSASVFDNFEAKNSSRSSRWDPWQTLPPWSVFSMRDCPLAEVGQR